MKRKPSIKDVAKASGVSSATVSNVFSGKKHVNEDLKLRVKQVAAELGYFLDKSASKLKSGKTNVIGVLVPSLSDTFFSTMVSEIERHAIEMGFDIVVMSTHGRADVETSRLSTLLSWNPEGVIVVPTNGSVPDIMQSPSYCVPTVLVDRISSKETQFDTVTINNFDIGFAAGKHLADAGHRQVLIVASNRSFPPIDERLSGVVEAIESRGGSATILSISDSIESELVTKHLKQIEYSVSGVVALNYTTTLACLNSFSEQSLVPGEDISFIAFDDDTWMSARINGLSAVKQPVMSMASVAWERLIQRIKGGDPLPCAATVLKAELVKRNSVVTQNTLRTA